MKKTNQSKMIKNSMLLKIAGLLFVLSSCVDNEFTQPPIGEINGDNINCFEEVDFRATTTINALKSLFAGGDPMQITQDIIISGIVISSDEAGNFHKELILQSDDGGIVVNIDRSDLYNDFKIGQTLFVKCNELWLGESGGQVELGKRTYVSSSNGQTYLDQIPDIDIKRHIFRNGCPAEITPLTISITDITDDLLYKLIEITDVQFNQYDVGEPFAEPVDKISANRELRDCDGNTLIVRTSGFAIFAGDTVPGGKGSVVAVLSKYNNDFQLLLNAFEDISMQGDRCAGTTGGTAGIVFEENFETVTPDANIALTGWVNYAEAGTKLWIGKEYNSNKYAQFSAYNSGYANTTVWLISPAVNFDAQTGEILTFNTKDGYNNGATLEVFISTDYSGSGDPTTAAWTKLNAIIASGTSSGYASDFTASGDIDLSGYTGNGYIAFKYTGSDPSATTTYQLDDVKITGQ